MTLDVSATDFGPLMSIPDALYYLLPHADTVNVSNDLYAGCKSIFWASLLVSTFARDQYFPWADKNRVSHLLYSV